MVSADAEKPFGNILQIFLTRILSELRIDGKFSTWKGHLLKPIAHVRLNGRRLNTVPLGPETPKGLLHTEDSIQCSTVRNRKRRDLAQKWGSKAVLSADNTRVYAENSIETKAIRAEKVTLVKIWVIRLIYKNQLYFCILTMNNWK